MSCNFNVTTNAGGIPYISNTNVTVGTEAVDIALGFRRIQPIGYFTVHMENAIPSDATTTLPVLSGIIMMYHTAVKKQHGRSVISCGKR